MIALMPLGAANRLAKSYVENIFIWNAWPILYGGFGALLTAVQMGQVGQMLNQNDFLGGLGNLEGSIPDRHREHCLLAGDRDHSVHRQANRQRRCGEHGGCDGWGGGHCPHRRRCRDRRSRRQEWPQREPVPAGQVRLGHPVGRWLDPHELSRHRGGGNHPGTGSTRSPILASSRMRSGIHARHGIPHSRDMPSRFAAR